MTIALSIKINDGIVLASDSATTMSQGNNIVNIYDNANKTFNLHKSLPVGAVTWGAGNIGQSSISSIIKNFRNSITEGPHKINPNQYTMEEISIRLNEFLIEKGVKYHLEHSPLGFYISGYGSNDDFPEIWNLFYTSTNPDPKPELFRSQDQAGAIWDGQPEALNRLIWGVSPQVLGQIMDAAEIDEDKRNLVIRLCLQIMPAQIFVPSMPLQDAIDIAEFMVQTTIKYVKYTPGNQTVGGPIEIAAITKHEGFKWIRRKHYFDGSLNP